MWGQGPLSCKWTCPEQNRAELSETALSSVTHSRDLFPVPQKALGVPVSGGHGYPLWGAGRKTTELPETEVWGSMLPGG